VKNALLPLLLATLLGLAPTTACGNKEGHQAEGEDGVAQANEGPVGILPLETFLTNINDPHGEKHARIQVKLAIVPEEAIATLQADALLMARMHDRVLTLLTAKTAHQLNDPEGKEAFRTEVREELNPLLKKAQIKEVLFSDFIIE
jgi:flagellar basal body-associated protein FliL